MPKPFTPLKQLLAGPTHTVTESTDCQELLMTQILWKRLP